jgi:hypothetical protein
MRVNHTCSISMGHITDASLISSRDVLWNHYGDRRVKVTRQDTLHCAGYSVGTGPEAAQVPREQCTGS